MPLPDFEGEAVAELERLGEVEPEGLRVAEGERVGEVELVGQTEPLAVSGWRSCC